MQVKNNDNHAAIEQDHKVREADKSQDVVASNKTHDVKKQAEQQVDKGRDWEKFAHKTPAHVPPNVSDVSAQKQVEASKESTRIDIEAKLREQSIKA